MAIINRLRAQLSEIMEEPGAKEKTDLAEVELLSLINPNYWNLKINGNIEVDIEKKYEELILSVSKHTTENVNNITTFRFYSLIEAIKNDKSNKIQSY